MNRLVLGTVACAAVLAGASGTLLSGASGSTAGAMQAAMGNWSGTGTLTGSSFCAGGFSMDFDVSSAGLVTGTLTTSQGAEGFRNTYQLQGKIDPVDGRSFEGKAAAKFVLHLKGALDGTKGEGSVNFQGQETCFGQWSVSPASN